jgi:pyruvate dehydrogenase kinase 2/3/4
VANDAIHDAQSVCLRQYGTAPEVSVYGDPDFTFAYVPSHLHHMTFELVRPHSVSVSVSVSQLA